MRLEKISIVNIKKHFSRVFLLTVALTMAAATVVALYTITATMYIDFQNTLDSYGTNMMIVPKSKTLPLSYSGIDLGGLEYKAQLLRESDIAKLKTIKNAANLKVIAPKLINIDNIKGQKVVIMGIDYKKEFLLKKWWQIYQGKKAKKHDQALLGTKAANLLNLSVGDSFFVGDKKFRVSGILRPIGSSEDDIVYINLKQAQSLYNQVGRLSMIEIAAWCYNCPIEQIVGQASEKLPDTKITAVLQAANTRKRVVSQFTVFTVALSVIMAAVAALIVFTNMLTAVRERRREIGIFRAIGYRRLNILEIIVFETILIGLLSGLIGYAAGFIAAKFLAPSVGVVWPVSFDARIAYFTVLGTMMLVILASLYPAAKAANLSPTIAISDV